MSVTEIESNEKWMEWMKFSIDASCDVICQYTVPYVRVSLVVAGKHIKTKKSSRKRNTIDPVWGETIR